MMSEEKKEEQVVMSWLRSHGYYRVVPQPNHSGIEADGKIRRMIVEVRTPDTIDNSIEVIKTLALTKNREAWLAIVEPDDNDITWKALK